jgi:hypothetical protein
MDAYTARLVDEITDLVNGATAEDRDTECAAAIVKVEELAALLGEKTSGETVWLTRREVRRLAEERTDTFVRGLQWALRETQGRRDSAVSHETRGSLNALCDCLTSEIRDYGVGRKDERDIDGRRPQGNPQVTVGLTQGFRTTTEGL